MASEEPEGGEVVDGDVGVALSSLSLLPPPRRQKAINGETAHVRASNLTSMRDLEARKGERRGGSGR